jgi:hypothetical protein
MSKSVTRKGPLARKRRRLAALRHRSAPARRSIEPCERSARKARAAAARVRKAVQSRIVRAFRKQIEGSGAGPDDTDLLMFARLAVAEHRLGRSLAQAKAQRLREAHALTGPATLLRSGAHQ